MTKPEEKILKEIRNAGGKGISGSAITEATRISAGRLYPILYRLEREGVIGSFWEGRHVPRMRLYCFASLIPEEP
jgi:DNA-binding PadR family transcriptional regulator